MLLHSCRARSISMLFINLFLHQSSRATMVLLRCRRPSHAAELHFPTSNNRRSTARTIPPCVAEVSQRRASPPRAIAARVTYKKLPRYARCWRLQAPCGAIYLPGQRCSPTILMALPRTLRYFSISRIGIDRAENHAIHFLSFSASEFGFAGGRMAA